jgi:hypothetical protein
MRLNLKSKRTLAGILAIALLVAIGGGLVIAQGDDDDTPITGTALERASAAALKHVGGGRVTDTEVGDEEGYYEIEVTRDDGTQVDVHLDQGFNVLGQEDEGAGDDEGEGDEDD